MHRKIKAACCAVMVATTAVFLTGCATSYPTGILYTDLKLPLGATSNTAPSTMKVGVATCTSVLALVTLGDASIEAAMKNGGITKVHHVDWSAKNFLGVYGEYTTTVYGD